MPPPRRSHIAPAAQRSAGQWLRGACARLWQGPRSRWLHLAGLLHLARARTAPAPQRPGSCAGPGSAAKTCLTHHQILQIVAPMTCAGLRLDMAASDRLARRLHFQGVCHEAGDRLPAWCEYWQLRSAATGWFTLVRILELDDGLQAVLQIEGARPAALLARLQAVPPEALFRLADGHRIACSHSIVGVHLLPTAAQLRVGGLVIDVKVPGGNCTSAALTLGRADGGALHLPADLLAVLGWDWSPLKPRRHRWHGSLRLRGQAAARADDLVRKLDGAARHLLRTLAEPPAQFHARLGHARLAVLLRLSLPWLAVAGLALDLLLAVPLQQMRHSPATAVAVALPALLLLWSLLRSEQAQLERPCWPRPLAAPSWLAG